MGVSGQRHAPGEWRLCRGSNLDRPVVQHVAMHYTDWATPAPRENEVSKIIFGAK
jgi:hypothetical protein